MFIKSSTDRNLTGVISHMLGAARIKLLGLVSTQCSMTQLTKISPKAGNTNNIAQHRIIENSLLFVCRHSCTH